MRFTGSGPFRILSTDMNFGLHNGIAVTATKVAACKSITLLGP